VKFFLETKHVSCPDWWFCLWQGAKMYMFFELKNSITKQGDIGVAESTDNGATWSYVGIALDEEWHLSYPFIFEYHGEVRVPQLSQLHKSHPLGGFKLSSKHVVCLVLLTGGCHSTSPSNSTLYAKCGHNFLSM